MGWLEDILKEVPLSAVLKVRVQLAEDRFARVNEENAILKQRIALLEKENEGLRAAAAKRQDSEGDQSIPEDTSRVLVHLFRAPTMEERDVGATASALRMETGLMKYHLDRLRENGFADCTGGNYVHGHVYWALSPNGRRYVVERKLV